MGQGRHTLRSVSDPVYPHQYIITAAFTFTFTLMVWHEAHMFIFSVLSRCFYADVLLFTTDNAAPVHNNCSIICSE